MLQYRASLTRDGYGAELARPGTFGVCDTSVISLGSLVTDVHLSSPLSFLCGRPVN